MRLALGMSPRADAKAKRSEVNYRYTNAPDWRFIEKRCPGARAAWKRDVGLPDDNFTIGITGGAPTYPLRAIAYTRDWSGTPAEERMRFEYLLAEKTWRQTHP